MKLAIVTVVLLAATSGVAQQEPRRTASQREKHPQPISAQEVSQHAEDVLKRVAESMGRYARDISEIPLNVESTVSKFDRSGNQKRRQSSSHTMEFVKRSYGQGEVRRRLRESKPGLRRVSKDELNGDLAIAVLALAFDDGSVSPAYRYELIFHTVSELLEVKVTDNRRCEGFDPNAADERRWCGEARLMIDAATLDPVSASFEAGGYPRTFGKVRYLSFRFVQEFQKVANEGSSEPFLLPKKVSVTYESDEQRTIIESKYSAERPKSISRPETPLGRMGRFQVAVMSGDKWSSLPGDRPDDGWGGFEKDPTFANPGQMWATRRALNISSMSARNTLFPPDD